MGAAQPAPRVVVPDGDGSMTSSTSAPSAPLPSTCPLSSTSATKPILATAAHIATTVAVEHEHDADPASTVGAADVVDATSSGHRGGGGGPGSRGAAAVELQRQHTEQQHQQLVRKHHHAYVVSSLLAGVGSGALASVICAPMDLVRTRMQVMGGLRLPKPPPQSAALPASGAGSKAAAAASAASLIQPSNGNNGARAAYAHIATHLRQIVAAEGYAGCFRGLGATLATVPAFWGLYFPLYEELKGRIGAHPWFAGRVGRRTTGDEGGSGGVSGSRAVRPLVHLTSAVLAGAAADFACNPMFVVRTRMQTEALHQLESRAASMNLSNGGGATAEAAARELQRTFHPKVMGIKGTIAALYAEGGLPVFWRGLTASLIGLSHVAIQFPVYEFLKAEARSRSPTRQESPVDLLLASGLSKVCASFVSYPHEVLRSRMMDARGAEAGRSLLDTARVVVRNEGYAGLYSGLHVALLRVVPNCCITFLTYELFLRWAKERMLMDGEEGG